MTHGPWILALWTFGFEGLALGEMGRQLPAHHSKSGVGLTFAMAFKASRSAFLPYASAYESAWNFEDPFKQVLGQCKHS